jgi:DNA-binding GntR family transcriptional regulator
MKRTQVSERIREMILRGQCKPGSKLRQKQLADKFGVAQGVVREALLELELHGWVKSIDRRGAFVTQIDDTARGQALEIRAMHEALAVRLCCERVTRGDLRELAHLAERAYEVGKAPSTAANVAEMGALDRQFHYKLVQLSGNELLTQLAQNYRLRAGAKPAATRNPAVVRSEHLAILRAIQDGRGEDAERLVREHISAEAG